MLDPLLEGLVWGLILSFLLGPVFFGLLHVSIHKGFTKGVVYASGVAFSDSFYIVLTYFGVAAVFQDELFQNVLALAGGLILIAFGLYYLVRSTPEKLEIGSEWKSTGKKRNLFIKGFLLNTINPSVFFFWFFQVEKALKNYQHDPQRISVFFVSCIITVFLIDVSKAYFANKIRNFLSIRVFSILHKAIGVLFLIFGLVALIKLAQNNW
ncbi:MAG: LysE family translocator [Cytophagaceae bacterium]|jgi:threonine/homoserine/homoserine lactone efflux protein|nr:LysE family translocator [Cytophagaceae bacterium]